MTDVDGVVIGIQGEPVSATAPTVGQVLEWDGTVWVPTTPPSSLPPDGYANGDLGGSYPDPVVIALQGNMLSATTPSTNQVLEWNGAEWTPTDLPSTLPPDGYASGDLGGVYPDPTVVALQGNAISPAVPSSNQVLEWSGGEWTPTNLPSALPPNGSASGDLSGSYPNPSVASISGSSVVSTSSSKLSILQGQNVSVSGLKTSNYTVQTSDFVVGIGTLTGTITITLPASPSTGDIYVIKDVNGTAGNPYAVLINGNGNGIDGFGTSGFMLNVIYQSATIIYTGSIWSLI